jgi:hypothetical protein
MAVDRMVEAARRVAQRAFWNVPGGWDGDRLKTANGEDDR